METITTLSTNQLQTSFSADTTINFSERAIFKSYTTINFLERAIFKSYCRWHFINQHTGQDKIWRNRLHKHGPMEH